MTPRILIVGADSKGSWQVRGLELGRAIGARVTLSPTDGDWRWAQVIVLVKRAADHWGKTARRGGVPVVWDALDFWAQPEDNTLGREEHIAAASALARRCGAALVIGATAAMAADLGGVALPHHSRPGLSLPPMRRRATTVAYEGVPKYLGQWRHALETACARLGFEFLVNPRALSDGDILVAFRDGRWDGWACRRWKSGIKYVNAIAVGRPILTQPCAAFEEIAPVGRAIDSPDELGVALETLADHQYRRTAYEIARARAGAFTLDAIAKTYRQMILSTSEKAA